jgi:glycosyltransferase involved in cell wall biosynthesis
LKCASIEIFFIGHLIEFLHGLVMEELLQLVPSVAPNELKSRLARLKSKEEAYWLESLARHSLQIDSPSVCEETHLTATVVVCTRNRPTLLCNCLEGLAHLEHAPDEVIVVDNTCGDRETEAVARQFAAVYIVEPTQGLSRARNRGMAESNFEVVAYLDDDATPDVNWLGLMLQPFKDPQVTAVTGKIVTPDSPLPNGARQPARSLSNKDPEWFEIASFGGLGLGSNMAFRRAICAGGKIFDERLGRGAPFETAEENYAFALVLSRGYTAVHLPDAIVYHPSGPPGDIRKEARNSIAFSILLFSEFPDSRRDLLRFLYRRLRHKPLTWPRDSPDPGEILTSGWRVLLAASLRAAWLFFRTRKSKDR